MHLLISCPTPGSAQARRRFDGALEALSWIETKQLAIMQRVGPSEPSCGHRRLQVTDGPASLPAGRPLLIRQANNAAARMYQLLDAEWIPPADRSTFASEWDPSSLWGGGGILSSTSETT